MDRPLNAFFVEPVEASNLPDYDKVIAKPMDFVKISDKLSRHEYRTTSEWFSDVCLIYENAMRYHGESSIWGVIAAQLLHDFKKIAFGLQVGTREEWIAAVDRQTRKLGDVLSNSPVRRGVDPLVQSCIKRSEASPRYPPNRVPDLVSRIGAKLSEERFRGGIIAILKTMHKDPPMTQEGDEVTIDVEKVKDQALVAISLYLQAIE